jgi:ribosome maturation protein SDO1
MKGTTMAGDREKISINLATLKKGEQRFEIVVDPDMAVEYRSGKITDIREVLKSEHIYFDAHKGDLASEHILKALLDTSDPLKVAEIIIKEGEIQLSSEFRKKLREQKRNKIIEIVHRNSINPQTNAPHPRERLESAMEEAKVRIDEWKRAEDQVEGVLKAIKAILPIRYEVRLIEVIVEPKFAPQSFSIVKSYGTLEDTQWMDDGSLLARIKLPAGLQSELVDRLNSLTHGSVNIKVIEK